MDENVLVDEEEDTSVFHDWGQVTPPEDNVLGSRYRMPGIVWNR